MNKLTAAIGTLLAAAYHAVSATQLQGYASEYAWRYNRRNGGGLCSSRYFFGRLTRDLLTGLVTASSRVSKSLRFGTGISAPCGVVCFSVVV